jgi:hypothetical protein
MSSLYQLAANRRWPKSAAHRRILGDGRWLLVLACRFPSTILMFQTKESRDARYESLMLKDCCATCRQLHTCAELSLIQNPVTS